MAGQILVPLNREDNIDEVVLCVEKLTRPGMRVVFLVHWMRSGFTSLQAYQQIMETGTGMRTALAGAELAKSLEVSRQKRSIEEKIFPCCRALQKSSVGIVVDVYTGSLRKAIANYAGEGDVHVVMLRSGFSLGVTSLLRNAFPSWLSFNRPGFSPVFVLYPGSN